MAKRKRPELGITVLGVYLIVTGLVSAVHLSFQGLSLLLGLLAVVAGVLLLLGR